MRIADDETMQGQKGSRLAKWIASADTFRGKYALEKPQKLQNLFHDIRALGVL